MKAASSALKGKFDPIFSFCFLSIYMDVFKNRINVLFSFPTAAKKLLPSGRAYFYIKLVERQVGSYQTRSLFFLCFVHRKG